MSRFNWACIPFFGLFAGCGYIVNGGIGAVIGLTGACAISMVMHFLSPD